MKRRIKKHLKLYMNWTILFIIVGAVFSYAMFQGGFVSWFLFYSVVTVIGLTFVVSIFTFRGFHVERVFEKEVLHTGETLRIELILKKKRLHPFFYVRVQDVLPKCLGENDQHGALFFFTFAKQLSFSYEVKDVKRGEHLFQDIELVFGDLFGLYEKRNAVPCEGVILVYPSYRKLEHFPVGNSLNITEGMKANQSWDEERSLASVRRYVPGDRLASIDWKQSARKSQLMTKEFESHRGVGVVVLVDSFQKYSSDLHFEKTIELASSFIATLIQKLPQIQVAFRTKDLLKLDVSQGTFIQALKMFAKIKKTTTPTPSVHRYYQEWSGASIYYICSELDERMIKAFEMMRKQKISVSVYLISTSERDRFVARQLEKLGVGLHTITV